MRFRLSLLLCLLLSFSVVGITNAYGDERADVRVIHAVSGLDVVDVYLGEMYAGTMGLGGATSYIIVPQGNVTLRVFATGTNETTLYEAELSVRNDQLINLVLMGNADSVSHEVYDVDRSPLSFGETRVTFVHAIVDLDISEMVLASPNREVTEAMSFSDTVLRTDAAGRYHIRLDQIGMERTFDFNAGTAYTVVLMSSDESDSGVTARIFASPTILDEASGYLRFAHTLFEGLGYDLYLNDTLIMPNFSYQRVSAYLALPTGDYNLALYHPGYDPVNDEPLLEQAISISENDWQSAFLTGSVSAPSLTLYTDDVSATGEGMIRISLVNTLTSEVSLNLDDQPLLTTAAGEHSEQQEVGAGVYRFTVETAESSYDLSIDGSAFTAFNIFTVVITPDGPFALVACALP